MARRARGRLRSAHGGGRSSRRIAPLARPVVRSRERGRAAAVRRLAGALAQVSSSSRRRPPSLRFPGRGCSRVTVGLLARALCAHLAASFIAHRLERDRTAATGEALPPPGPSDRSVGARPERALAARGAAWKAPAAVAPAQHRPALPLLVLIGLLATGLSMLCDSRAGAICSRVAPRCRLGAADVWGWLIAQVTATDRIPPDDPYRGCDPRGPP